MGNITYMVEAVMKLLLLFAISIYFISMTNACFPSPCGLKPSSSTSNNTITVVVPSVPTGQNHGRKKRTSGMAAEASAIKSFCYVFFNLIKSYCPGNAACQKWKKTYKKNCH